MVLCGCIIWWDGQVAKGKEELAEGCDSCACGGVVFVEGVWREPLPAVFACDAVGWFLSFLDKLNSIAE